VRVRQIRLPVPDDLPVRALMLESAGTAELVLTDEQSEPVRRRSGALLLSAAAGSGKTSVLVERFVRAIREDAVAPSRILAITFTERAAGELRERVRRRLLSLGEREAARDAEAASVGTFHGFCARLLRAHPLAAGLDPDFAILDEGLAARLREQAFRAAVQEFLADEREEAVELVAAYGIDVLRTMVEGVHARLRSRGQEAPRLPESPSDVEERDAVAACALIDELLGAFGRSYGQHKLDRGAVDFDDLELGAARLLREHEGIRRAWSERYELLMVDEFQDTNPRQLGILTALERDNLFTVGDEFQSIYGFRHAEVQLFRERRNALTDVEASLALTLNFRSVPALLEVVNKVFSGRFAEFGELRAARTPPAGTSPEPLVELLLSAKAGWEEDEGLEGEIAAGLPPAALWRQAEARLLAQRVAELVESGDARPGEVAVLLRAGGDLEVYERALQLRGLRTLAAAGGFWAHQQIEDLLAYLRTLANPRDEEALYGVLASPLVGVTRDGLALLSTAARSARRGVWEAISRPAEEGPLADLGEQDRHLVLGFHRHLEHERAAASQRTLSELIERAIAAGGYRDHVLALEWGERRLANVHKLLRLARRFEATEGRDLRGFLDHAARLQDASAGRESDAPVEGVEPDAVRLMSIHAAKGLEFPVVCVADLGRAPYVRQPELLVDGERLGLLLRRLDGAKGEPTLDYEALAEERRRAESEEEDRILYVAMTRARERLLLSGAVDFDRWPTERQGAAALSWLAPALAAEVPALAAAGQPAVHDLTVAGTRVRLRLSCAAGAGDVLARGSMSARPARVPSYLRGALAVRSEGAAAQMTLLPLASHSTTGTSTLSYTSLSLLERCGYRYYLERVLGIGENRAAGRPGGPDSGLEARARGTLLHSLLETLDFRAPHRLTGEDVAARGREQDLRVGAQESAELAGLIERALRTPTAQRIAAAAGSRREHPFAFALAREDPLMIGVIDLLAQEADGGSLVIDYKSDRVTPEEDLALLVERDYGVQRLIYALAVLRTGAPRVEIVHWFLERPSEPVAIVCTAGELAGLEKRLASRVEGARARGFAVSARPHRALCLTCPGRGGLCSWSEMETLRESPDACTADAGEPPGEG
jgi:ATP-dependent exoDNAse (exonuclease V) beta subunit